MKIMDFKEVILAYETYLMQEGKVESTIDSYVGDIRGFLEFLESKKVSFRGNLTRLYITSYKIHLTENGYSINTINKKINSLHSFNFFLVSKNLCTEKVVYPNKDKIKIGYEIPFTRYFYKYEAPRPSVEIMAEILDIETELEGALSEVFDI